MLVNIRSECPQGDLRVLQTGSGGQQMKDGEKSVRGPTPTQNGLSSVDNCVDQSDLGMCISPGTSEPQSAPAMGGCLPAPLGSSFSPSLPLHHV